MRGELRKGIRRTLPFLLSHHTPARRNRCHRVGVLGRQVHLCARCSGIYPGLLVGLFVPLGSPSIWVIALLPAPALLDWVVTTFRSYHDYNVVRTATGLLLGYGYGVGLIGVFVGRRPAILLVGLAYGGLAVALLALHRRSPT